MLGQNGEPLRPGFLQGFTRDIGSGGMCVELKSFGDPLETAFGAPGARLRLTINITFQKQPIRAVARVAWFKKTETPLPAHYLIGVAYTEIDDKARTRIFQYARRLLWLPRATVAAVGVLLLSLGGVVWHDLELVRENRRLVQTQIESAEKRSGVASELYELRKKKSALDAELSKSARALKDAEEAMASLTAENLTQKAAYESQIAEGRSRQRSITSELESVKEGTARLATQYKTLETRGGLTSAAAQKAMVDWLRSHRNVRTGLVASFEGDPTLEDTAFTYDQSLACQAFLLFGDIKLAEDILSFYDTRARTDRGAFYNAYGTLNGAVSESTVQVGPNVWIGIAALQYEHRVKDGRFLPLARRIGDRLIGAQDGEGGLKAGPAADWYSTEHNLDAYAFFRMMSEETGDARYAEAARRALDWVRKYAYSNHERRLNRGKGDATIATDTFSWAVAAIGPAKLKETGLDPEAIMQFAEEHCEVKATFYKPNGQSAEARGFDFAKAQNVGRGGVISTEWTAQVIVTYGVLSNFFASSGELEKAELYRSKADLYLNELQKLMITSPSRTGQGRGCLPYASIDNVDTGHGWRTPAGRRTGSVAATAYGLFAWAGYNPFDLEQKKAPR